MKSQLKRYSMLELIKFQYLTSAVGILRDEKRCHCTGHNPKPYNGCLLYNCSDKGKEGIGRKLTPDMPVLCHYTHGVSLCLCCVIMSMQTKVFVLWNAFDHDPCSQTWVLFCVSCQCVTFVIDKEKEGEGENSDLVFLYHNINNISASSITKKDKYYSQTKHVNICYHFIHHTVQKGLSHIEHVPIDNMATDLFMKGLPPHKVLCLNTMVWLCSA